MRMKKLFVMGNRSVFLEELRKLRAFGLITDTQYTNVRMSAVFINQSDMASGLSRDTLWVNCDVEHKLENMRLELTARYGPASNIKAAVMALLELET